MESHLWSLVLAAGSGRRLAALTGGVPKQFWNSGAGPTLLDQTLDRTDGLAPAQRTVVVVDRTHKTFVDGLARRARVVYQPCDRGTAAGVLFGLTEVLAQNRAAVILLTPSDHGVARPAVFADEVRRAADAVRAGVVSVTLFGAHPDHPDPDYGWIVPVRRGHSRRGGGRAVAGFIEKPPEETARRLFAAGGLWNTMVLVGRASELFELYRRHLPQLADVFARAINIADPEIRHAVLTRAYAGLPTTDFSRDLLEAASGLTVRTWPMSMGWSDLGTPARLARWRVTQEATPSVGTSHSAAHRESLAS